MTDKVAIILISTDEGHLLIPQLESLFEAPPNREIQVTVVDNASTDGARDQIVDRWPHVRLIVQDRREGLPTNLRRGMAETSSDYAMLCDADMLFHPGAVDALADFLDEHPAAGIVKPKLDSPDGVPRPPARRWYTVRSLVALRWPLSRWTENSKAARMSLYADWDFGEPRIVDWVPTAGVMVRRRAFDSVSGFDERFSYYFEDVDFCLRMHESGWEVWFTPAAVMVHLENRASVRVLSEAGRTHLRSMIKFWWKHKGLKPRKSSKASLLPPFS